MNTGAIILFIMAGVGLALLVFCIVKLVSYFTGWRCEFSPFIPQMTIEIPRPGRYAVCLSRDRFWLLSGQGDISQMIFPTVDFAVIRAITQMPVEYRRCMFGVRSSGMARISQAVGTFDVTESGEYQLSNLYTFQFTQTDMITVRKHLPVPTFVLMILGIVFSSMMFLSGIIVGCLMLGGVL